MPTIKDAYKVIAKIFTNTDVSIQDTQVSPIVFYIPIIIVVAKDVIEEFYPGISLLNNKKMIIRWTTYLSLMVLIILFGVLDSSQFIYVSF
jgi:hypothetical protein